MEVEDQQRRQDGIDPNPPRNARERTLIKAMESYSQTSEKIQVGISELEYFLLSPGVSIFSFAENAWDGDTADSWCSKEAEALSRFVVFERSRGIDQIRGVRKKPRH